MNLTEYEEIQKGQKLITIDDLVNKSDRVLLYGYTIERKDFTILLLRGKIIKVVNYKESEITTNDDYIPNKRVYPHHSDYEFCSLLMNKGYDVPYTTHILTKV